MNYKIVLLLAFTLTTKNWAMQQAQVKAAPASVSSALTTIAQNPRYLFYTSAACFAGVAAFNAYLGYSMFKNTHNNIKRMKMSQGNDNEKEQEEMTKKLLEEIQNQGEDLNKTINNSVNPLSFLYLAAKITFAAACILKAKNIFSPSTTK